MKTKVLAPIPEKPNDYDDIAAEIMKAFYEVVYRPLLVILDLPKSTLQNSTDGLIRAISSGRLRFHRGEFKGKYTAAISRELMKLGAEWDRKQGSWKIPLSNLPVDIQQTIRLSEERFVRTMDSLNRNLGASLPQAIVDRVNVRDMFETTLFRVNKRVEDQIKSITVAPKLSEKAAKDLSSAYSRNLKLYIKKFTDEEIIKLRQKVEKNALSGLRYEDMVKSIQRSYKVTENKAKFLARQETSLMMTSFKEVRFREAGSEEYIWQCVHGSSEHPVRPLHKKNDGKKFRWDSPPTVNEKGDHKNPGQDYNCRCTARPIMKYEKVSE